ncbi:hypothetical protein PQX77_003953 [Marasmius sp. AFHP31]|nr:hypothetical protein PQX77_003953 [Marasmius sp. AFHP31]
MVTRYIDDSYGDPSTGFRPSYYPIGNDIWRDQSCGTAQGCHIVPDTKLSHNGTYATATYKTNMSNLGFHLMFQGTSITVYFILANDGYTTPTTTRTECNFTLDGSLEKPYVHDPLPNKGIEYNVAVFKKEGLENRVHSLNVDTGKRDHEVFLAFDYATYTVEEPDEDTDNRNGATAALPSGSESSEPKSNSLTGAIVGGVIGGLVLIISALIVTFSVCRNRLYRMDKYGNGEKDTVRVDPFMAITKLAGESSINVPRSADVHQSQSPDPIQASGRLLNEASNSLTQQQQRSQFRGRHGDHYTPSDSDTIRSGVIQHETSELREQIRELQAQMLQHQGHEPAVANALPPIYTPQA